MISSLEMKNWKTHENTKIEFSRGANILMGMMGAGKSSTIDAICFGLFGTFPSVKQKKVKLSEIVKNRPRQEKNASVKVTFTVDDDIYSVERELGLTAGGKARLTKNGEYVQSQPERVNEEVEKVLKVDYDLFARAVYSEQNRLDYFLELKAKDRKDQIDELLGLDKFATASDNVNSLINKIKDMVENQKKDAEHLDLENVTNQLSALELELGKIVSDKQKIEIEIVSTSNSAKILEEKISKMKELDAKREIVANELVQLKSKVEYARSEVKTIEEKELGEISEIVSSINALGKKVTALKEKEREQTEEDGKEQTALAKIDSDIYQLDKKCKEREDIAKKIGRRELKRLEKEHEEISKDTHDAEAKLLFHMSEKKTVEKSLEELKEHIGKCPVCERELAEEMRKKLISEKQKTIENLTLKIKETETIALKGKKDTKVLLDEISELRLLSSKMVEYQGIEELIKAKNNEKDKAKVALESCRKELGKIRQTLEAESKDLVKLEKAKDDLTRKENYAKEIVDFEKRIKDREGQLEGMKVDRKELEKLQADLLTIRTNIGSLAAQNDAHKRYMEEKKAQIKDKEVQVQVIERINKDIKSKEFAIQNLVKFRQSLDETKMVLRNKLVGSINIVMQDMWPDLYPYGDYNSIMLNATSEDYVLSVLTNKDGEQAWQEVDSIASGGERSTACLALRVAFSLVLVPNLRWIILDEPTHNIDEDGIKRFVALFNEKLPKIVDQVFIITHDELLKQSINSNIYVLSRNKDESGSTIVQKL